MSKACWKPRRLEHCWGTHAHTLASPALGTQSRREHRKHGNRKAPNIAKHGNRKEPKLTSPNMGTASPTTHNASPALGDKQCTDRKVSQVFAGTFSCKSRLGCAWCYCHPRVDGNHCLLQLLWRRMLGTRLARTLDARPVHQHANSRLSSGGKRSKALLLPARSLRTVGLADPQSPNGPRIMGRCCCCCCSRC